MWSSTGWRQAHFETNFIFLEMQSSIVRFAGRAASQLRPVRIIRHYTRHAEGSVLIECGQTRVLCTACFDDIVVGL